MSSEDSHPTDDSIEGKTENENSHLTDYGFEGKTENENVTDHQEKSTLDIQNKKSVPTGMIVALIAVVAVAAFFAGSYFSNLDTDVVTQSDLEDAISKLLDEQRNIKKEIVSSKFKDKK